MLHFVERTTVSALLRLNPGDSTLKLPLYSPAGAVQPLLIQVTEGEGRGRQATSSRGKIHEISVDKKLRGERALSIFITEGRNYIFKTLAKVTCCDFELKLCCCMLKSWMRAIRNSMCQLGQWSRNKWVVQGGIIGQSGIQRRLVL